MDTAPEETLLSKLRQRSAIIFTIGLAISIASFVENLHMGKAAIAFVVEELSKIQGWEDFVRATAAIFHGALEWWRGVLRDLLSFLPFEVPQWMHDPISLGFFALARIWNANRLSPNDRSFKPIFYRELRLRRIYTTAIGIFHVAIVVVALTLVDGGYVAVDRQTGAFDLTKLRAAPEVALSYFLVFLALVTVFYVSYRRFWRAVSDTNQALEAEEQDDK